MSDVVRVSSIDELGRHAKDNERWCYCLLVVSAPTPTGTPSDDPKSCCCRSDKIPYGGMTALLLMINFSNLC